MQVIVIVFLNSAAKPVQSMYFNTPTKEALITVGATPSSFLPSTMHSIFRHLQQLKTESASLKTEPGSLKAEVVDIKTEAVDSTDTDGIKTENVGVKTEPIDAKTVTSGVVKKLPKVKKKLREEFFTVKPEPGVNIVKPTKTVKSLNSNSKKYLIDEISPFKKKKKSEHVSI